MNDIKVPLTSRSNNFKQLILTGAPAVVETVLLMLNTPINRSQEDPYYGFDLEDFLFKVKSSTDFSDLKTEFINKVKSVTLREDITVEFEVNDKGETIDIKLGITDSGKVINVPINVDNKRVLVLDKITLE